MQSVQGIRCLPTESLDTIECSNGEQEAHGPQLTHLTDIATLDMQMQHFSNLSSQLMKRSSFKQFLVLKKNIWACHLQAISCGLKSVR